jgi:ParB-like nuclease domain
VKSKRATTPASAEGVCMLPIDSLKVDEPELRIRVANDSEHLGDLIEAYRDGLPVPPVIVVHDGSIYRVVDGFYRVKAATIAGRTEIAAEVRQGSRRAAILAACGMNAEQLGLPRSRVDKRRAVELLLADEEWRSWSDGEVAKACAVSGPFVAKIRKEVTPNVSSERRVRTKHGTDTRMDTSKIGKRQGSNVSSVSPTSKKTDAVECATASGAQPLPVEDEHVLEMLLTSETATTIIARADIMTFLASHPDADLRVTLKSEAEAVLIGLSLVRGDASVATTAGDHAEVAA